MENSHDPAEIGLRNGIIVAGGLEQRKVFPPVPRQVVQSQVHEARRQVHAGQHGVVTPRCAAALERISKALVVVDADILDEEALVEKDVCTPRNRCPERVLRATVVALAEPRLESAEDAVDRVVAQLSGVAMTQRLRAQPRGSTAVFEFTGPVAVALRDLYRFLEFLDLAKFVRRKLGQHLQMCRSRIPGLPARGRKPAVRHKLDGYEFASFRILREQRLVVVHGTTENQGRSSACHGKNVWTMLFATGHCL